MQFWFDFLSGDDLQIQIILQIMKCDLKIKKTNQFKCDCDFDLQYCDLFQGLGLGQLLLLGSIVLKWLKDAVQGMDNTLLHCRFS